MNIDQDIICDLYPLYHAGEASPATQALVETYLAAHPEFAKLMRESQETPPPLPAAVAGASGHAPIRRIQQILRWRSACMALAIACSLLPFSFVFKDGGLTWFMLRDAPQAASLSATVAVAAWITFFSLTRRLHLD